jgi:hypothetical protein
MFGRRLAEYVEFEGPLLAILATVGLVRLGLSIAGLPDTTVRWASMNAVVWIGAVYCGVAVYTRGFGSYRQLLPLVFLQMVVFQAVALIGIGLAIAGARNIFGAPEYTFGQNQWIHGAGHATIGIAFPSLLLWGVASLALLITKRVARRPVVV